MSTTNTIVYIILTKCVIRLISSINFLAIHIRYFSMHDKYTPSIKNNQLIIDGKYPDDHVLKRIAPEMKDATEDREVYIVLLC